MPQPEIATSTERLLVRNWTDADREPFHAICSDAKVMRHVGDKSLWSREQSDAFVTRNQAAFAEHGVCQWAVVLRETNELAGFCGFVNRPSGVEMGWRLASRFHGRGLGTEAARAVLDYGQSQCGVTRVYLIIQAPNRASVRVAEKLGFRAGPVFLRENRVVIRFELP